MTTSARASRVCLIGATVKRELFEDESPIGQDDPHPQRPLPGHRALEPQGANMMGQDQDDCIIAPWTTIKFRVNSVGPDRRQAAAAAATATINTLNNPYVAATPLYPQAVAMQSADTPQPVRQTSIDFIQAKAASAEQVPVAIEQITALLRERHHLAEDQDDDFKILDLTEIAQASARDGRIDGHACCWSWPPFRSWWAAWGS